VVVVVAVERLRRAAAASSRGSSRDQLQVAKGPVRSERQPRRSSVSTTSLCIMPL